MVTMFPFCRTGSLFQIKSLSGSNALPEYKVQEMKRPRFILLHYGIFKIGWDWLILLCTFYIAIIVPYNAAFVASDNDSERASIVSDVIVEMLFIIGECISCDWTPRHHMTVPVLSLKFPDITGNFLLQM